MTLRTEGSEMLDFFANVLHFIAMLYSFPIRSWQGGCSDGSAPVSGGVWAPQACESGFYVQSDKFIAIFSGLIVYGITLLLLALVGSITYDRLQWLRTRVRCQVCGKWTDEMGTAVVPECKQEMGCCGNCHDQHLNLAVERHAQGEPRYNCPACTSPMDKRIENRIIIDVCKNNACGGIFLSPDELEGLKDLAEDLGYSEGKDVGAANAAMFGFLIGSVID